MQPFYIARRYSIATKFAEKRTGPTPYEPASTWIVGLVIEPPLPEGVFLWPLRLKSEAVELHLLHHREQSVGTGGRQVILESDLVQEP